MSGAAGCAPGRGAGRGRPPTRAFPPGRGGTSGPIPARRIGGATGGGRRASAGPAPSNSLRDGREVEDHEYPSYRAVESEPTRAAERMAERVQYGEPFAG